MMNLVKPKTVLMSAAMLLFAVAGCSKGDGTSTTTGAVPFHGQVAFSCAASPIAGSVTKADNQAKFEIPAELIPEGKEFSLRIHGDYEAFSESGVSEGTKTLDLSYTSIEAYATSNEGGLPYLPEGTFTASVSYGNATTAAGEGKPAFYGEKEFTVVARGEVTVDVTASLSNSIVSFATTQNFDGYYPGGASLKLTTEYGEYSFTKGVDSRLIFMPPNTQLAISGSAIDYYGKEITFTEYLLEARTKKGYRSTILVDQTESSSSSFTVTLDDSTEDGGSTNADMNPNNKE